VHKTGRPGKVMTGDAGAMMIQRRAAADAHSIMRQTGHKDRKMLEVYAREFNTLVGNAVLKLDL